MGTGRPTPDARAVHTFADGHRHRLGVRGAREAAALRAKPAASLGTGALLTGAARALIIASAAITTVGVARLLGPLQTGRFAVLAGFVAILVGLAALGTDLGVVWMVGSRRWSAESAVATTGLAAAVLGVCAVGAGLALYGVASASAFTGIGFPILAAALGSVPFALKSLYITQIAIAEGRYVLALLLAAIQATAAAASVVILAGFLGLGGAALGLLTGSAIGATAAHVLGRRLSDAGERRIDLARLRAAAAFGWKPYVANLLSLVIYRIDLFILNASAGGRQAGYYAVAVTAASVGAFGADAVSTVLFPRIATLSSQAETRKDLLETETRALRHATLALAVGAALAAVVLLLLEPLLGASFGPAKTPGFVILPGIAGLGLAGAMYASLAGRGRPRYALTAGLVLAPISIGLYLALIPPFGATGAAGASTVVYCSSAVLAGRFLRRESGRPTLPRLVPTRAELADYRALLRNRPLR